jgi:hypothetical protein
MKVRICTAILLVALVAMTAAWADVEIFGGNSASGVVPGGIAATITSGTTIPVTGSPATYNLASPGNGTNYATWGGYFAVPTFNESLGTLNNVQVTLHTTNGAFWYAQNGTNGAAVNITINPTNVLTYLSGSTLPNSPTYGDSVDTLGVATTYNGIPNVTGHGDNVAVNTDNGPHSQADLIDYETVGPSTVNMNIASTSAYSASGGGASYTVTPSSLAGLTVEYDYTGFNSPEPSSLALLLTGLPLGLIARRRPKK